MLRESEGDFVDEEDANNNGNGKGTKESSREPDSADEMIDCKGGNHFDQEIDNAKEGVVGLLCIGIVTLVL